MFIFSHLNGGISWSVGHRARRKVQSRVERERREGDPRETLGGELGIVDDNLLDLGVRRLVPMRNERCHVFL